MCPHDALRWASEARHTIHASLSWHMHSLVPKTHLHIPQWIYPQVHDIHTYHPRPESVGHSSELIFFGILPHPWHQHLSRAMCASNSYAAPLWVDVTNVYEETRQALANFKFGPKGVFILNWSNIFILFDLSKNSRCPALLEKERRSALNPLEQSTPRQQEGAVRFTILPLFSPFWVHRLSPSVMFVAYACAFLLQNYFSHSSHLFLSLIISSLISLIFVILANTLLHFYNHRLWGHEHHRKFKYIHHLFLPLSLLHCSQF